MTEAPDWEPGDPLFTRPGNTWQGYFYNFRPLNDEVEDRCSCPDRASWPEPLMGSDLDRIDRREGGGVEAFISDNRAREVRNG